MRPPKDPQLLPLKRHSSFLKWTSLEEEKSQKEWEADKRG